MPYNIANASEWVLSVRGVLTSDQVEGGADGVANFAATDLTKRTNWLKERVDALYLQPSASITGAVNLTAADVRKALNFRTTGFDNGVAYGVNVFTTPSTTAGQDLYTIIMNPPTADGVVGITLQYRVVGSPTWNSQDLPAVPFTDLQLPTGSNYEFRILTRGGANDGRASDVVTTATPTPSGITTAVLPDIAAVDNLTGFYFMNSELQDTRLGRILTSGSDVIVIEHQESNQAFVKPGRAGFHIIKDGSKWRLIGANPKAEVGLVQHFAAQRAPRGYVICDGRAYSRTAFADLFEAIGTTFGAPSGSTFSVPDLRSEFIRGWDMNRGIDGNGVAWRTFGSFQTDDFKSHRHEINTVGVAAGSSAVAAIGSTSASGGNVTRFTGGTETRPRNVALLPCIKF